MNTVTKKNSFLVTGEAGVGKSHYIRNEARIHNAKLFRWNVRIDRSLREGREILHTQVRSKDKLYVWIEGADDLTQEAQAFLRRILETSSTNVISMLEVRETWKLSQPIISRCIPICITRSRSFRSERSYQMAQQFNLYKNQDDIDVKNISLKDIITFRKKAYDPIQIIHLILKEYGLANNDVLKMFKKIGAGYSPWIQLAYFLAAFSSKTKDT
jgi:hypothetical protein